MSQTNKIFRIVFVIAAIACIIGCKNQSNQNNANNSSEKALAIQVEIEQEIDTYKKELPVKLAYNLLCTDLTYDPQTMVLTYYYAFTEKVDKNNISTKVMEKAKALMIEQLKASGHSARFDAGVKYDYVYKSMDGDVLFHVLIDSSDL